MRQTLLLFLLSFFVFQLDAQNNWQDQMHDRSANFYNIQADFNIYYDSVMVGETSIPKGKGIKQFKRWEYYWQNRIDQFGNFPPPGYTLREIEDYLEDNENRSYETGTGNWEIVGPTPLPTNGTGQPNGNGRINCIAFHPTDANTIFVGAPAGGFWKSTDNGTTWTEYSNGLTRLGVSSIVVHPTTPNTIYIGTGDRDGGDSPGYGVWRSTNGGATWSSLNNGMGNRTVNEILMHPSNPDILLAATSGSRIYRSTNAGANWTSVSVGTNCKDIAFHPSDPNIVYGAGGDFVRSTDNGVSYTTITSGVPNASRIAIGVSVDEPNWVYLLGGNGNGLVDLVRSTDSGLNFTSRTTTPNILGWDWDGSDVGSQAWYDLVMAVNPNDANEIYTGGINIWKSTDGGTNMDLTAHWVGGGGADDVHADHHALEFSPHNNDVYNGNDGGIYFSSNSGTSWNDITSGLAIAQVYKIGIAQTVKDLAINGYQDNGTAVSEGLAFRTEIGGDGMECIIDPTDANYMYGSLYYGAIRRSTNNGFNFGNIVGPISEEGGWVTPFKLDPGNASRMYAGFDNIWRTDDVKAGTVAWTSLSNFGGTNNCVDLAIAPSDNNVMYVSRSSGQFYRTANAQAGSPAWADLSGNLPSSSTPKDIEIDPLDEDHLFIAVGTEIYESTDAAQSWSVFSGTLPNISLNTIVIDQNSPVEAMYVGMDVGVYYRDMNSSDWELYNTNLPNIEVTELEIYYNTTDCESALYASTYAQGLWKSDLKDPGTVAPIACFESDVQVGCTATPITFTDLSSYTPNSWAWSFTPNTVTFVNSTTSNSENPEVTFNATGLYTATLTATNANGSDNETKTDYISIINSVLSAPTLTAPANTATGVAVPISFSWTVVTGTTITYDLDVATDASFTTIIDAQTGLTTNAYSSSSLNSNTTYYWRVKAFENCAESPFTPTFSFTTGNCSVTSSLDVPVVISSSGTPTVTSDLVFGTTGTITGVSVANLDIPHTWINDLDITLTSPDGTTITLIDRICAGENDINVLLNDGAATSINAAPCPPDQGYSYQPENALSAFIGEEASGTWTLTVTDNVNADGGSIDGWSLAICTNAVICTDPSVPTLSFDADPICPGANTNLIISGTLNDATSWEVYSAACGTGLVGSTSGTTLSISPTGNTTYYVRGEGGCVTSGSCATASIIADDSTAPTISCPSNATENVNGSCQFSLADYTGLANVNDACDASSVITQSPNAATLLTGNGTVQTITLTATDASANSANCTFDVTLNDNTGPTVTCPSVTEINPSVNCGMPDLTGSASVTDNCDPSPTIISQSPAVGALLASLIGTNQTLTITAVDASGNTGNCSVLLPVADNIPPVITCPSNTTQNANGFCEISLLDYTSMASATDGCDAGLALSQSPGSGALVTGVGTVQTVTLTVIDASSNSASCTFDVTVVDNNGPTVTCPSIAEINPSISCGMPDLTGSASVTDNCDPSPTIISQSPAVGALLASLIGTNQTLTITAVDASGNTGNCSVLLPVVDNIPPVITCPSNTTQNANGFCEIALLDYTSMATAADGCDAGPTLLQSPGSGALVNGVGTVQTVTLTVIDASSNSASCIFDVTVVDNTNPTIACPSNVTVTADPTTCEATPALGSPTIGDNCSTTPAINDAPASFPVGNTTVTWIVTDGSTNSASCTQSVTVNTNTPAQPGAISGANSVCSGDSETYSITAVSDATFYTWNLPTGWTGSSTTNSISVTTGPNAGNVSVTANNTCASSTAQTLAITLQSSPVQPSSISGSTTPCSGTTENYFITAVPGATSYTWTLPSGWVGTSTSTSISTTVGSESGSIEVVAIGSCGNSIAQTLSVAPVPTPAQPVTIAGLFTACPSSSQTYSVVAVSNADSYNWTLPSGWTGTSSTNSITVGTSGTGGTISVAAANSCGQAGTAQTLAVSVPTVDDGIPCTVDACNPTTGIVTNTPNNSACDDGLWCNGQETCDALLGCLAGTPPTVNDGNSCTDDSCNELLNQVENINNSDPCDDGNPNTINDQCVNGVCVGTPIGNVWTGNVNTTWGIAGNWSMFVPTSTDDAIIPTSPTGGVFPQIPAGYQASIDNLDVQPGAIINVVQDGTLDVFGVLINNGTINVNDGGSLLQRTGSTIAGSGIYHIQRQGSAGFNYDYWSSPINNQIGVPGTSYLYDSNVSTQTDADDSPSDPGWTAYNGAMIQGKGYAGRGAGLQTFSGTAGNGNISFPLVYHAFDNTYSQTSPGTPYNLVGNPYPSAISAAQFVSDNPNIDGTIAFWDDDLTGGSGYNRSDYAYWNGTGGLGTGAGINGAPTGFISTGQGFMVRALNPSTTVSFNNAQRVSGSNTQFFRTNGETSRLWFSVENGNSFNQVLVGLLEEATNEEDRLYDAAKMRTNSSLSLAAMANSTEHAIMAFPPPLESQLVPLLITTTEDGTYTFKANTMENFVGFQVTFNDILMNTSESIFEGATIERYLNAGEHENRFYLNFSASTVTNIDEQTERTFTAYVSDENLFLNLNHTDELVATVELIDVSGRVVYSLGGAKINNGAFTTTLSELTTGVYLVRLSTENWAVTQRVFYR